MVFSSTRKLAQQTAERLIGGHFALMAWWALRHAGVLEAMAKVEAQEKQGLDPLVHATRTNMSPEVLTALLDYLATQEVGDGTLVAVADGKARLTAEGKALLEYEDGVLQMMRAYEPVMDACEHLLAKLKVAGGGNGNGAGGGGGGGGVMRKGDYYTESQGKRYAGEVYPAVLEMVEKEGFSHVLDIACGTGDLLIHLAKGTKHVVGVGVGGDGALVRRANAAITGADLEKRLIAVTADPVDVCTQTQRTFDRIGISRQLWNEIDCLVATTLFSEYAARNGENGQGTAAVAEVLSALPRHFPKAHVVLIEPVASARFEKNYYSAELALLLRLTRTVPWAVERWRQVIVSARLRLVREVHLTTDGLTLFLCKPGGMK